MVKQFCESMLRLKIERSKSLANLVMGSSSQTNANSVVEISLNPCYHFQWRKLGQVLPKRKHYPVRLKHKKMKKLTG